MPLIKERKERILFCRHKNMPYQEGPASEDTRVYTISCEGELSFIEAGQDPSMWLAISVPILVPLLFWWTTLSLAGFLLIRTHRVAISADGWSSGFPQLTVE